MRRAAPVLVLSVALVGAASCPAQGPPPDAYMRYSIGRLLEVRGSLTDALVQYRLARSLDPGSCGPAVAVARVLLGLGRAGEALEPIERARAACPEDADVLEVHAEVLLALGNETGALSTLAEPARADTSPELLAALAEALLAQGKAGEAEALYAERCRADSLDPVLAFLHARVLAVCGRNEDAVSELERAERLDPGNRAVSATLAHILVNMGRPGEAVPRLERLVGADAREQEYVALARAYGDVGRHAEALSLLEGALAERGKTPSLLAALGASRYRAGDRDGAIREYERVLEIEPESVLALNFIAYALADAGHDLDRAVAYAERAVTLAPGDANVRDTLGWAYFRLGRLEEARTELGKAVELGATDAVVHEHLGDALAALGLVELAIESWRKAAEIEPGRPSALGRIEAASPGSGGTP